ncbi:MAG: cytochrome c-type biogenesis protein CcmH, partial [Flavobacteriaceae bacterium]
RLVAGDSDREVHDFLVARYGEIVRLRPPLNPHTYLLWGAPLALLLGGALLAAATLRRRAASARETEPLSEDEKRRLAALLDDSAGDAPDITKN